MIVGLGFLTVVTAAITSAFIEAARRRLQGTASDGLSLQLDQIGARLAAIEALLHSSGHAPDAAP